MTSKIARIPQEKTGDRSTLGLKFCVVKGINDSTFIMTWKRILRELFRHEKTATKNLFNTNRFFILAVTSFIHMMNVSLCLSSPGKAANP